MLAAGLAVHAVESGEPSKRELAAVEAAPASAGQPGRAADGSERADGADDTYGTREKPSKSYGIYVGKNLTKDGSVLLGGTGDEVSSHWLKVQPAERHEKGETIEVGATEDAAMPGKLIEIPQVRRTAKYISMDYSDFEGFPAPLTNGGINEHQVAIRDIWSNSREELVEMTPKPQTGPQYSDEARIALERAKTAREAVDVITGLVDEYGHTTYGGNSHLIADEKEGWVILQFAGSKGLWAAERLGPNDVRMSYPGYLEKIPTDCAVGGMSKGERRKADFLCSDNFVKFAEKQGWWSEGEPFDVNKVYGEDSDYRNEPPSGKYAAPADFEEEIEAAAPISVKQFMAKIRDPRVSSDRNGYGQVASLKPGVDRDLIKLWVAPVGSVTSPFVPYHIGVSSVPPEFRQHRYLTKDSASTFLNPKYAPQEGTEFAGRLYKRLMYHTCTDPKTFYPEVRRALTGFEDRMLSDQAKVEQTAATLIEGGERGLARRYLTEYSHERAGDAMDLGNALLDSIEARTKLSDGIPHPDEEADGNINDGSSDRGGHVSCYRE